MKYFFSFMCCFAFAYGQGQTTLTLNNAFCEQRNFFNTQLIKPGLTTVNSQCDTLFILTRYQYRGAINLIQDLKKNNALLERNKQLDSVTIAFYKENITKVSDLFKEQNQTVSNMLALSETKLGEASRQLSDSQKEIDNALKKIEQAQSSIMKTKKIKPVLFAIGGALLGYLIGREVH